MKPQANGKRANGKMKTAYLELIPDTVGIGTYRKGIQNRALAAWTSMAVAAVCAFYQTKYPVPPRVRAAILALVFPGAGFVACANWIAGILFVATLLLQPLVLFAWFGSGGLLFPILHWSLSAVAAYFVAGPSVFEPAGYISLAVLLGTFTYFRISSLREARKGQQTRAQRNSFLPGVLESLEASAATALPPPEDQRELSLEALRSIQYIIDQCLVDLHDFSNVDTVDQFQTAAIRYKLYWRMYTMAMYQGIFVPNFHGYLNEAYQRTIEKSLLPTSVGFWKWEKSWGHFSTDWDPVKKDNIMVTGYLLPCIALYTAHSGDDRYTKPNSLKFQVTKRAVYPYDIHSMDAAIVRQWAENPYCLFPCEPNWIYTMCNMQGRVGQVVYDRVFGTDHAKALNAKFEESLNANFTEADGSILTLRSEMTGFTIPGICGAINTLLNALLCRGHLDHVSRRMYAIFKQETVTLDEKTGDIGLVGLVGADKIDPGNYESTEDFAFAALAVVAGEYGDEPIRKACLDRLKRQVGTAATRTGAASLAPGKASGLTQTLYTRALMIKCGDWKHLLTKGPPKSTLAGPVLSYAPYPGVLVARAWSHGADLDLVLYPSADSGTFELEVEKLKPHAQYRLTGDQTVTADSYGRARFSVPVEGRTEVSLHPMS